MEVLVSKYAGFCGGVKAAVLRLRRAVKNNPGRTIKVLGELVHNQQVNQEFIDQGVVFIHDISEVEDGDLLVIRAHGEPEKTYAYLEQRGIEYVDATCHKVKITQDKIQDLENDGYQVAIFGEENHPETQALLGHTRNGFVVNNKLLSTIKPKHKVALICQSTSSRLEFEEVCLTIREMVDELKILSSFCDFTLSSQDDVRSIRDKSDIMLVIGGINSSNTKRLVEACAETVPTHHIQTASQIDSEWFNGVKVVGVSAGASTPAEVIEEVLESLKKYEDK